MKYEINSTDITYNGSPYNADDFKKFLNTIKTVCDKLDAKYFIIGAFARELIINKLHQKETGRVTKDIDLAIKLHLWDKYIECIDILKNEFNYQQGNAPHELISPEGIIIDLIPFGNIEDNRKISFPPNFDIAMNMLGFKEIFDSTLTITFDNEIETQVASLEGIIILKLIAWNDRQPAQVSQKHVIDIRDIIKIYYSITVEEIADEASDLFDVDNFDEVMCGAEAVGRKISLLCKGHDNLQQQLEEIFSEIFSNRDSSLFISQMISEHPFDYDYCLKLVLALDRGFKIKNNA